MRILIVNAHSIKGKNKFEFFVNSIMNIISEQKELIDIENEFHLRDKDNLDDFLYEEESSYIKKDAANRFDQIDLIFIQGDANLRPWSSLTTKILCLLRMCLKTNKIVFAASFAMQALIFLSATNLEKKLNIVNGKEGSKISEIKNLKLKQELKHNDFFLDNASGDLYFYNYESKEWLPRMNIGLHQRRAAQEYLSIGQYMVKAPTYRPKPHYLDSIYNTVNHETTCYLKTYHLQNPILKDLPLKFTIPLINSWDVHTFNFMNLKKSFKVLAESDQGIIIVQYPTMIGVQFDINEKYPKTVTILKNFIIMTLQKYKNLNCAQTHIIQKTDFTSSPVYETLSKMHQKNRSVKQRTAGFQVNLTEQEEEQESYQKDNIERKIKHVGYSIKKQEDHAVNFNSVWEKRIKYQQKLKKNESKPEILTSNQFYFLTDQDEDELLSQRNKTKKLLTQEDIRSFLHPSLQKENLTNQMWVINPPVPGSYSQRKQKDDQYKSSRKKFHLNSKSNPSFIIKNDNLKSSNMLQKQYK